MTVQIEIRCSNAAFREDDDTGDNWVAAGAEVSRILRELAEHFQAGVCDRSLFDVNGNRVGWAKIIKGAS